MQPGDGGTLVRLGVWPAGDAVLCDGRLHSVEVAIQPVQIDAQTGCVEIPLRDPDREPVVVAVDPLLDLGSGVPLHGPGNPDASGAGARGMQKLTTRQDWVIGTLLSQVLIRQLRPDAKHLAVRGENPTAFDRRYIPADGVAISVAYCRYAPSSRLVLARRGVITTILGASGTFTTDC